MDLELEGINATLFAGYHEAAKLPVWRITTVAPDFFRVDAAGVRAHPVWYANKSLVLSIPRGKDDLAWEWAVEGTVPAPDEEEGRVTLHVSGDPKIVRR